MFREFLYMDSDRIQSIIAQLNEGVLTEIVEGKGTKFEGRARIAAGVLSAFLPIGFDGAANRSSNLQSSKVLHDYAYSVALKAVEDNDMLLEVQDWDRDNLPLPDNAFILVRGDVSVVDYSILHELAENEDIINKLFGGSHSEGPEQTTPTSITGAGLGRQQRRALERAQHRNQPSSGVQVTQHSATGSALQQMRQFMDAFMGDMLLACVAHTSGLEFKGPLSRSFLREDIRHYIFKRGGAPQEGWAMLAQVSHIPDAFSKIAAFAQNMRKLQEESEKMGENPNTATDLLNLLVEPVYGLQEIIASVSYPSVAVTPIAIYRELGGLH